MIHYISADGIGTPWVANELRQVQLAQIPFVLHSLRRPERVAHQTAWAKQINDETRFIYPIAYWSFLKNMLQAPLVFRSHYFAALWNALFGERESFRVRLVALVHFFVAVHWAVGLRSQRVDLIHSQWIHSGGTVGMYGAWLLGVPFSFTGHAVDLFRQRAALRDKIRRAAFIICISEFHRDFFLKEGAKPDQLTIAYCGLDLSLFKPVKRATRPEVFTILSAGRLIEKKGFEYLIDACAILKQRERDFKCIVGGSGPLEDKLRERVSRSDLEAFVTITGLALMQETIPNFMAQGSVFCLPCVWAKDDDVDGLPQLLMEAMACGLPGISTRLVGIPDLINDRETGLLVSPESAVELADAIEFAMDNESVVSVINAQARQYIETKFNLETCLEPLLNRFRFFLPS